MKSTGPILIVIGIVGIIVGIIVGLSELLGLLFFVLGIVLALVGVVLFFSSGHKQAAPGEEIRPEASSEPQAPQDGPENQQQQ